jgi:hypothetical protein
VLARSDYIVYNDIVGWSTLAAYRRRCRFPSGGGSTILSAGDSRTCSFRRFSLAKFTYFCVRAGVLWPKVRWSDSVSPLNSPLPTNQFTLKV